MNTLETKTKTKSKQSEAKQKRNETRQTNEMCSSTTAFMIKSSIDSVGSSFHFFSCEYEGYSIVHFCTMARLYTYNTVTLIKLILFTLFLSLGEHNRPLHRYKHWLMVEESNILFNAKKETENKNRTEMKASNRWWKITEGQIEIVYEINKSRFFHQNHIYEWRIKHIQRKFYVQLKMK